MEFVELPSNQDRETRMKLYSMFFEDFVQVLHGYGIGSVHKVKKISEKSKFPEKFSQYQNEIESYVELCVIQLGNNCKSALEELKKIKETDQVEFNQKLEKYQIEAKNYRIQVFHEIDVIIKKAQADLLGETFSLN